MSSPRADRVVRYHWREPSSGVESMRGGERVIGQDMFHESWCRTPHNLRTDRTPPPWAGDLLRIARAAFVVDKDAVRSRTEDGWTRHLRLSAPVSEPDLWRGEPLRLLTALLETMTGDHWEVVVREPGHGLPVDQVLDNPDSEGPPEVALFSGGLDSLSWAARRATEESRTPLTLITFGESGAKTAQLAAIEAVRGLARRSRRTVYQHHFSQETRFKRRARSRRDSETSTRTRGFLYTATAIRVAAAEGTATVQTPENGQIALNPPLSAARSAACSTRSVHPRTLYLLNSLVAALGGGVTVENPLGLCTKGEVCLLALEAGLSAEDLEATVSCGRPPNNQPGRQTDLSCGRCWPCLVRRSGLHHALGTDRTPYWCQPWDGVKEAREDWVDLVRWLRYRFRMTDLIADTPFPPGEGRAAALDTIGRGRAELREWMTSLRVTF